MKGNSIKRSKKEILLMGDPDFVLKSYHNMFQLNTSEAEQLVSQNVIPHKKYFGWSLPYAFTEQGVAMFSSILNSERAIKVNIEIMRAFVRLRQILASNKELAKRLDELEKKYDTQFKLVFDAIRKLMVLPEPEPPKKRIGFLVEEPHVPYKSLKVRPVT